MAVEWGREKRREKKGLEGGKIFKTINRFCKGSCLRFCKWDYFDEIN